MRRRSRFQPKWLEIFSIGSTAAVTVGGSWLVVRSAHWAGPALVDRVGCIWGTSTERVLLLATGRFHVVGLLVLVPTALAFLGASANGRGRKLVGAALLVLAPQLALLGVGLCLAALALPVLSVVPRQSTVSKTVEAEPQPVIVPPPATVEAKADEPIGYGQKEGKHGMTPEEFHDALESAGEWDSKP